MSSVPMWQKCVEGQRSFGLQTLGLLPTIKGFPDPQGFTYDGQTLRQSSAVKNMFYELFQINSYKLILIFKKVLFFSFRFTR